MIAATVIVGLRCPFGPLRSIELSSPGLLVKTLPRVDSVTLVLYNFVIPEKCRLSGAVLAAALLFCTRRNRESRLSLMRIPLSGREKWGVGGTVAP